MESIASVHVMAVSQTQASTGFRVYALKSPSIRWVINAYLGLHLINQHICGVHSQCSRNGSATNPSIRWVQGLGTAITIQQMGDRNAYLWAAFNQPSQYHICGVHSQWSRHGSAQTNELCVQYSLVNYRSTIFSVLRSP